MFHLNPNIDTHPLIRLTAQDPVIRKSPAGLDYYELSKDEVPGGWSNDPSMLEEFPDVQTFQGYHVKISKAVPILWHDDDTLFLFHGGDSWYLWNPVPWVLERVENPKDIKGVLANLHAGTKLELSEIECDD